MAATPPDEVHLTTPETVYAPHAHYAPTPSSLWQSVHDFIRNHTPLPPPPPEPIDENVSNYAAMIEADMARYQYAEETAAHEHSTQKKRV